MTAKEKLRAQIETFSEQEAEVILSYIELRREGDPVLEFLDSAPEEDEPTTPEEEEALREARAQAERRETVPLEELQRELD